MSNNISEVIRRALLPIDTPLRRIKVHRLVRNSNPKCSTIKIALIPMNLPIEECFTKLQKRPYTLLQMTKSYAAKVANLYRNYTRAACKLDAKVICFSEFSFPQQDLSLKQELAELSNQYKAYIIAGSYHDLNTCYNTSLLIFPHGRTYTQYKINIAEFLGENCRPGTPVINVWDTEFGLITVLICLDVYDWNNKYKFLYFKCNSYPNKANLIISPSYNPHDVERLRSECLCYQSCVVCVNDISQGDSNVFLPKCEAELVECECPGCSNPFLLCEVDLDEVRNAQIEIHS